ncbi:TPA: group II intron reverse transcriptase/maturase [Listeria monocytogenes]|nr:group II intron reverse transcriptase/maturase [Listeria monocytogenes]
MTVKVHKKKALRFNEYYDTQKVQDELYRLSSQKFIFKNLMDYITQDENILLAYRTIKSNKGSRTSGTNKKTILDVANENPNQLIQYVKNRLKNYQPHAIKRVEIPKPNGKTRPLGIPTIEDRLVQQCIRQVLESILEAKFYKHSYGFRPDRSTHHAIAIFQQWTYKGFHYVVDIDIKGFFDNVNHGKLLKQLWTLGIRDKTLIAILSRMLKAEIKGIGKPKKGTPQGGILSPLLANVVLNELDWWVDSQWDGFPTDREYSSLLSKTQSIRKYSNLKEIKIVRYADDFKIMCKDYRTAQKIFIATKKWLKERLYLEVSPDKSKITNLRKNYSEFLGFKLKVKKEKANKYTNRSRMCAKAKEKAINKIKNQIKTIAKEPTVKNVNKYNAIVLGLHNYYKIATLVNLDFIEIAYITNKSLDCRTKRKCQKNGTITSTYLKFYKQYNWKKRFIANTILFPLGGIKWSMARMYPQDQNRYTEQGRMKIHQRLKMDMKMVHYLLENPSPDRSIEFNDNRISLFVAQRGKCHISGSELTKENMEVHHIQPLSLGGDDRYTNLIYITKDVHKLIHAKEKKTIQKYRKKTNLDSEMLIRLNTLRILSGNNEIEINYY